MLVLSSSLPFFHKFSCGRHSTVSGNNLSAQQCKKNLLSNFEAIADEAEGNCVCRKNIGIKKGECVDTIHVCEREYLRQCIAEKKIIVWLLPR